MSFGKSVRRFAQDDGFFWSFEELQGKIVANRALVVEKLRAAWVSKRHRGSFDYAQDRLFGYAPELCVAR
jgi:hypothetical protein